MVFIRTSACLAIFLLFVVLASQAAELVGKVVAVSDGDTLTLLTPSNRQIKVRLAEIDTPESGQPYGSRAKQALSDLAFGREARVDVIDTDRYGRTVGRVYVGETQVNAELVRQGAAWVYREYARDRSLFALEEEAKALKRGLWALPEAERVPPWEWRRGARVSSPPAEAIRQPTPRGQFTCGGKRYCKEMTNCAEAKFYLTQCGLSRLDGDGDGLPCEALCR